MLQQIPDVSSELHSYYYNDVDNKKRCGSLQFPPPGEACA